MQKLISTLVGLAIGASAIAATPAMADPDRHDQDRREWHDERRDDRHDAREDRRDWHADHRDWRADRRDYRAHEWRRGERFERAEWYRYPAVDYRSHHLRAPPRGYEWRYVDGRYILAAVATGIIADIILSHR